MRYITLNYARHREDEYYCDERFRISKHRDLKLINARRMKLISVRAAKRRYIYFASAFSRITGKLCVISFVV